MGFAFAQLTEITTISDSPGVLYANPAATTTYIRLIIIHNSNTTVETVKLWNVPDNGGSEGSEGDTNLFYQVDLQPNQTEVIAFPAPGLIMLDENDGIQGDTITASKVTFQMYGGTRT